MSRTCTQIELTLRIGESGMDHLSSRKGRGFESLSTPSRSLDGSSDDFLDLSEPRLRGAHLGSSLPMPPLRDGLQRRLELPDPVLDPVCEVGGYLSLPHEVAEQLSRLRKILRRFVPEPPVVREQIGDVSDVNRFPISVRRRFHLVSEEKHDQVHEVLPSDPMDLELFEDHVRERDCGGVELQPSVARFLSEQDIVAEFEPVEEDVDVESILALIVHESSVAEESVDHVVGPESEGVEHAADRATLTRVPH